MKRSTDNPVFDHLTRGSRWPSRRTARRIGLGLAVGVWALIFADAQPVALFIIIGLFDVAVGLAGLCMLSGFTVPAIIIARHGTTETLALIRITHMPAEKTLAGVVAAALYRLRLVQAIARWFLPAGAIGLALMLGPTGAGKLLDCPIGVICQNWGQTYVARGCFFAILVMGGVVIVFPNLMRSLASLGVWVGLKWPELAPVLSGVVLLVGIIAAMLMIWATYLFVFLSMAETLCVYMPIWAYLLITQVSRQVVKDSIRLIAGRTAG